MTEQLTTGPTPRRLLSTYPSRLTTWQDCPARYRLMYVEKVPSGPPWAHQSLGVSVHNALRDWWALPLPQRDVEHAETLVRAAWIALGYRDDAQSDVWQDRAVAMVTRYVATLDPADEPVGLERTVGFRTDVVAMSGRVDRIDRRRSEDGGEELVIVDYKTGRHLLSTTDARSSLALAAYSVAASRTLRVRSRRVELHHLPSGEVVVWEHDQASLERHVARIDDIARDVVEALSRDSADDSAVDAAFPARPGPLCGYCDVVRDCAAGLDSVAGQLPTAWAVLDRWEDEEFA